jgi:ABC-2 type transport system permease protein
VSASSAIARRAFADGRTRTLAFAALFAASSAAQVLGYRNTYPTHADRLAFAHTFGGNGAIRLFYGVPHDLLTVGGYAGWRVGGFMSLFAAVWAALAAVRAMRTEEDSGRHELLLAAPVSRARVLVASLVAVALGACVLWLAMFLALALSGLPVAGSAYLALVVISPIPPFVGVGAMASQIAPSRRFALALAFAVLAVAFALRVVADTVGGGGWLRWATPLGWVEEMRAFAQPDPWVLVLPVGMSLALILPAILLATRRDLGVGMIRLSDSSEPRLRLLSSPLLLAVRSELGMLAAWIVGVGSLALIMGVISNSFSSGLSETLRRRLERVGGGTLMSPVGVLGFYFVFFALVISLFAAGQVTAARHEEAEQRLETLLALPVGRRRWLLGRLALALAGALGLAFTAGVLAWAGALSQAADVSLADMLEAGANCLPLVLLFLALSALGFAAFPRAASFIGYGLIVGSFLWELLGSVLGVPHWTLGFSPFHHIGLVPVAAFRPLAACVMLGIAVASTVLALALFDRRDLTGA